MTLCPGGAAVRRWPRDPGRLGRLRDVREPGMRGMIPLVDKMRKVSLRTVTMPIPSQQVITRDSVGRSTLDRVRADTETLNEKIKEILEVTSKNWGVLVEMVELEDIQLPDTVQRAMAREAEAEREKRGKIIAAEGEALSAGKLAEAADVIAAHPIALQLRSGVRPAARLS